jgi:hypothetical protein
MKDLLNSGDLKELSHIRQGGRWCIDGRKEKRLVRLGLIFTHPTISGFKVTDAGKSAMDNPTAT